MAAKKPKFEKLSVNLYRRGERRYETAYNAPDAAKIATKWAKQGWDTVVLPSPDNWYGTKRPILMQCLGADYLSFVMRPSGAKSTTVARCTITPAFKKRIQQR